MIGSSQGIKERKKWKSSLTFMSKQEYSLKYIKLSKYASSLVSNRRDEMSHFLTGVFDIMEDVGLQCFMTKWIFIF